MDLPETADLPLFPLRTVLFPGGLLPLRVFETRYMDMAKDCLKNKHGFGVCLIHAGKEVGEPAIPENVGCYADIVSWDMEQLGLLQLRVRGGRRFRIRNRRVDAHTLVHAEVEYLQAEQNLPLPEDFGACAGLLKLIAAENPNAFSEPLQFEDASWVGYRLCEVLPIPLTAKQKLLELDEPLLRLEILQRFLEQRGLIGRR
jgi:uncharacterized protein